MVCDFYVTVSNATPSDNVIGPSLLENINGVSVNIISDFYVDMWRPFVKPNLNHRKDILDDEISFQQDREIFLGHLLMQRIGDLD